MSGLSTHVLDTSTGLPARGVPVRLDVRRPDGAYAELAAHVTDDDGRVKALLPEGARLAAAEYRLTFDCSRHFETLRVEGFYREVVIGFVVREPARHHHVPLLLSPFGYATYRGS
jgi:5-hydroxyisourate hydrolase